MMFDGKERVQTLFVAVLIFGAASSRSLHGQGMGLPSQKGPTISVPSGGFGGSSSNRATERVVLGVVRDADQKGVTRAEVHLKDESTSQVRVMLADEKGAYVFSGLPLKHDYQVWVQRDKQKTPVRSVSSLIESYSVTINFKIEDLQLPKEATTAAPATK